LSVTQRRILTLLDSPGRLRDLALRPMVNTAWLTRDAAQLQKAGLIALDAIDGGPRLPANAESAVRAPHRPVGRPLPLVVAAIGATALVWAGWHLISAPATPARTRVGVPNAAASPVSPAVSTPEPPVIATRVLRGETAKDARSASAKSSASPAQTDAMRPSTSDAPRPIIVEPRVPRTEATMSSTSSGPEPVMNVPQPVMNVPQPVMNVPQPAMNENHTAQIGTPSRSESTSPRADRIPQTEPAALTANDSLSAEGER
jgi:hypothetical protein